MLFAKCLAALLFWTSGGLAISLDVGDPKSIKNAASTAAFDMMSYYQGNQTGQIPGKLPNTWWEGGAMFMTLIQYWHWTGDDSYNEVTIQGMQWQKGEFNDYFPANWSAYLGNDDQVFWGLAAMTAAELDFPNQPGGFPWLGLAQGVFNTQVPRWDTSSCHGGLHWQVSPLQLGYDDKNAISNGGLFQLAARLALYTNNQTYADWAEKIWDWSTSLPLFNTNSTPWYIADLVTTESDCMNASGVQFTYNYGTYISGAAYMYNLTKGSSTWKERLDNLLTPTFTTFFPAKYGGNIMAEVSCESTKTCDGNMVCYKGFLSTWLAFTSILAPYTYPEIIPKLQASAQAAAKACTGGSSNGGPGTSCGTSWVAQSWDGTSGIGEEMSVVGVFSSIMIAFAGGTAAPLTASTGGDSTSVPDAGEGDVGSGVVSPAQTITITNADRVGAGILTAVVGFAWLGMIVWIVAGK